MKEGFVQLFLAISNTVRLAGIKIILEILSQRRRQDTKVSGIIYIDSKLHKPFLNKAELSNDVLNGDLCKRRFSHNTISPSNSCRNPSATPIHFIAAVLFHYFKAIFRCDYCITVETALQKSRSYVILRCLLAP